MELLNSLFLQTVYKYTWNLLKIQLVNSKHKFHSTLVLKDQSSKVMYYKHHYVGVCCWYFISFA